ncbi:TonB-dependent receptor [Pedobacter aquae]|uniref:TonB-dependent receptor n=1 Tax=Pedobacter aquae TaxID=2605747 RepID=A0A5C0VQE3_9SPHI|nr:TonB-dependent receptor [Pedobacter aquae]QEK53114.1 TonB-dependent receptor [Pedobacter aquae]
MKRILLIIPLLMAVFNLLAQERNVKGKITDKSNGEPIIGASVFNVETKQSAVADLTGSFSIAITSGQTLRVSYLGYQTYEYKITSNDKMLNIILEESNSNLNEVIVTGYQTERKKDITGAVAIVDVNELNKQTVANGMRAVQGQVPGVYITGSGSPSAPTTVRIRGIGTFNNNDPLYIIDGVPTKSGLHELNQADIESMQILKDAASASVYGARAANGVVIITTKRAKGSGTQVSANAFTALSSYLSKIEMLNAKGYGQAMWQAHVNNGINPNLNSIQYSYDWSVDPVTSQPVLRNITVPEYLNPQQTIKSANTNWFNEISRMGVVQNYDAQVSNAGTTGNQLLSIGYYDNKGIINTTGFNRISVRLNTDYKLFGGAVVVGQNLSLTKTKEVQADIINSALQALPIIPVRTVDGIGWGGPVAGMNDRQNPVRVLEDNKQNHYDFFRLFGNFFAEVNLGRGFSLKSNFGIDYGDFSSRNWDKRYVSGYLVNNTNRLTNSQSDNLRQTWTNSINYKLENNKHRLDVFAGTEYVSENVSSFNASITDFVIEDSDYLYLDAGVGTQNNSGSGARNALFSYFTRASYSFLDRYLFSATIRRDGSSRFGSNNKYGIFPALSAGWRISEEPFFKNKINFFDDLKLRASWGLNGNQEIANNAIFNIYLPNYNITAYDISGRKSGTLPSGYYLSQNENPNLRWEQTMQTDLGIDYSILNQKVYGSLGYFVKKTSDILILPPYAAVLGEGGNRWVNGASMANRGFEFQIGHRSNISNDLSLDLSGNFDIIRSKVTELPEEVINSYGGNGRDLNILGRTVGSFFGYVADGLFNSQAEVDAHAIQPGKDLGRIRYRDITQDGVIDINDQTWIGNPLPKMTYGFNANVKYKAFDISFLLQGLGSVDVYNSAKMHTDFWSVVESSSNKGVRVLDAWTPLNSNSTIPALTLTDGNSENRSSTYFIENGSYLKLRNLQIGYTVDAKKLAALKIKSLRFYVGGDNLAILWKSKSFTGLDPENAGFGYPNPTIFTGGLNLKF